MEHPLQLLSRKLPGSLGAVSRLAVCTMTRQASQGKSTTGCSCRDFNCGHESAALCPESKEWAVSHDWGLPRFFIYSLVKDCADDADVNNLGTTACKIYCVHIPVGNATEACVRSTTAGRRYSMQTIGRKSNMWIVRDTCVLIQTHGVYLCMYMHLPTSPPAYMCIYMNMYIYIYIRVNVNIY